MGRLAREGSGLVLIAFSMGLMFWGIWVLARHDYLGALLVLLAALGSLRAAVELLRPTLGE